MCFGLMWNLESYHFTFERLLFSRGNRNQLYCSKDQNSIFIRKSLTSLFTRVGNSGTASSGAGQTAAPGSPPALDPWMPCAPVHQADSVVFNTSGPFPDTGLTHTAPGMRVVSPELGSCRPSAVLHGLSVPPSWGHHVCR